MDDMAELAVEPREMPWPDNIPGFFIGQMAEEEMKDIEVSIGRIHMVLAWLHTFFVLAAPGADEAGVIPEGRDESPNSFRRIDNIVMNDDVDRVDVQVQPWIPIEPQDTHAHDAGEMVAYEMLEMLEPFVRAAGALMELNVDGMIEEAVPRNAPVQQDVQGMDAAEQMEDEMLGPFMDWIIEPVVPLHAPVQQDTQGIEEQQKEQDMQENVRSFDDIPGTRKKTKGQRKATHRCKCCPTSRFGGEREDGTWPLDLERAVGWKNPITMRLSTREFQKGCRDHVRSKNGRHRFWKTVERVDEMPTSGSVSSSQQDRESLKKGGKILEGLFHKYVESWNGYENINDYEKEGVIIKFEQARRVLQKWNIEISPLSEKLKDPK
jgi:hypothetical protein